MARRERPWTVLPHVLKKLEDNLWIVEGALPGVPGASRRMSVIRRADGSLLFYQAVPVDEATLEQLRAWGRPGALVVPHNNHGLDATPFSRKLGVGIYGPARDEAALRAKMDLAGTLEQLPPDPAVTLEPLDGTRRGEPVAVVRSGARVSLVFADAFQASTDVPWWIRPLGFGGGPKVPPLFKLLFATDVRALKAHLTRLAQLPGLARLIPCHGDVIDVDAAAVLRAAAERA